MFYEHFLSLRIKDLIFIVYHEEMESVRDLLMSPQNTRTISGFLEYCDMISARVIIENTNQKSTASLKRALSLVKQYDIAMTEEQKVLLSKALQDLYG